MFIVCVGRGSKYMQFQIIFSLLRSIIVDAFEVEPHSIQHGKIFDETSQYYKKFLYTTVGNVTARIWDLYIK